MKKYLLFSSTFALASLSFSSLKAQNYGISMNTVTGSNDYVDCGSSAALSATNIKTMECWVKLYDLNSNQEILSRSVAGSGIELLLYNNNLAFYCMNGPSALASHVDYPVTNLSTDIWYHVAATWDGSTKESMKLYVNGISVGTRVDLGNINTTGVSNPAASTFKIGQWSYASESRLLKGMVDEARIWSINRTVTDIKSDMYASANNMPAGLLAYYPMNESSGTMVRNSTAMSGIDGTATSAPARLVSPIRFASNAVNFDGVNDKITVPANTSFNLSSGTIECWIHPSSFSASYSACLVGNRGSGGTRYSIHASQTLVGLWNGTSWQYINYTFVAGTWYHIAFVSDAATSKTTVYINGVNRGDLNNVFGSLTGQPLTIGASENSGGDGEWFAGDIDDVRIWSTLRTQQQIADNMNNALSGTETGLVANYTFNTGISSSNNTGLKIALDATPNNLHGMLTNFGLVNTTSNYVTSQVVILPVQLTSFAGNKSGITSLLSWTTASEQDLKRFVVESSTDGKTFTTIGTVAAISSSSIPTSYSFTDFKPLPGTNYYRLQLADADGKTSYSKTVTIKFPATAVISVSPNPATSSLFYTISSLQATKATVTIISAAGQKVYTNIAAVQAGNNSLSVDVSRLPAGNYTLQVLNTPAGVASSQQFAITR